MVGLAFNLGKNMKASKQNAVVVFSVWLFVVLACFWQCDKRTNSFLSAQLC